jgi:hypothetical protein
MPTVSTRKHTLARTKSEDAEAGSPRQIHFQFSDGLARRKLEQANYSVVIRLSTVHSSESCPKTCPAVTIGGGESLEWFQVPSAAAWRDCKKRGGGEG